MVQGVIEVKYNAVNRPYFVLKDEKGGILSVSESFTDRIACERNIIDIRESIIVAQIAMEGDELYYPKLEMIQESDTAFHFRLYSLKGDIILKSESYCKKDLCEKQMRTIKRYFANAKIKDLL